VVRARVVFDTMSEHQEGLRGPLEDEKKGPSSQPGRPQPEAAEVESARLLEGEARRPLRDAGFADERIRQLADQFVAEDRGQDTGSFIEWARAQGP
jgi:hypothetical protein